MIDLDGCRLAPEIISHAAWLYHCFCLGFRDVEDLPARGTIAVSYETIRQWCQTLRRRHSLLRDTSCLDELCVTIYTRSSERFQTVASWPIEGLEDRAESEGRVCRRVLAAVASFSRSTPTSRAIPRLPGACADAAEGKFI